MWCPFWGNSEYSPSLGGADELAVVPCGFSGEEHSRLQNAVSLCASKSGQGAHTPASAYHHPGPALLKCRNLETCSQPGVSEFLQVLDLSIQLVRTLNEFWKLARGNQPIEVASVLGPAVRRPVGRQLRPDQRWPGRVSHRSQPCRDRYRQAPVERQLPALSCPCPRCDSTLDREAPCDNGKKLAFWGAELTTHQSRATRLARLPLAAARAELGSPWLPMAALTGLN